jgi:hypothetical protein
MYNFMTGHQNSVASPSQHDGNSERVKQQGIVWSFSSPDSDLGWYYPDPPPGNGNLSTGNYALNNDFYPRKAIVLSAKLSDGTDYNRASKPVTDWIVPDDFGEANGMGTHTMHPAGTFGQNNGGIAGAGTLAQVYPAYESSLFVKMAKFIQDAEDAIYARDYGANGAGGYHNYIDIDSLIDWHIALDVCSNWELIYLNGQYMHYDPGIGKLKMGCLWDMDRAWSPNASGATAGFMRKTPFWIKELTGWEMTGGGTSLPGSSRQDRKDPYYITRFKARWNEVRGTISTELGQYIDAQISRFNRISAYQGTLLSPGTNNAGFNTLKTNISNRVNSLTTEYNQYNAN